MFRDSSCRFPSDFALAGSRTSYTHSSKSNSSSAFSRFLVSDLFLHVCEHLLSLLGFQFVAGSALASFELKVFNQRLGQKVCGLDSGEKRNTKYK